MKNKLSLLLSFSLTTLAWAEEPKPAPIDTYPIHADGGLIYDPLRREAERTGQLQKYQDVETTLVHLQGGGVTMEAHVPKQATAYDVVPIPYTLRTTTDSGIGSHPVHVSATAFKSADGDKGGAYDLSIPGRVAIDLKYLGSVTAKNLPEARHRLAPDFSDKPAERYPAYDARDLVRSGVVEAGEYIWFSFEFTNSGDTVLDPEGLGGFLLEPKLFRQTPEGKWEPFGIAYNRYVRIFRYIYPGETERVWVSFMAGAGEVPTHRFGLGPGKYKLVIDSVARYEAEFDWIVNIWSGRTVQKDEWEFEVAEKPAAREPAPIVTVQSDARDGRKLNRWLHSFQEFMTSFDGHLKGISDAGVEGILYLQVAPWTQKISLKLLTGDEPQLQSAQVPIAVESASLAVNFQPTDRNLIWNGDKWVPLIATQTMSDMRANIQMGPNPRGTIRRDREAMLSVGVSMVTTTAMPWMYDFIQRPYTHAQPDAGSNPNGDAVRYFLDLARERGPRIEGWINYPYARSTIGDIAAWVTGEKINLVDVFHGEANLLDPALAKANATAATYQFTRWGDNYGQNAAGEVPFSVEDSRGWLRLDVHIRYPKGPQVLAAFQEWSKSKFGSLENLNNAWDTSFSKWEEIDPEHGQSTNEHGHKFVYADDQNPFHDWSPAVLDWDWFRTELRVRNYTDLLASLRETIPNATLNVRTEGGNVLVAGVDPADPNPHLRHVFYSQRRCGLIAEVLQAPGTIAYHSDYTTMPYTPTEVRELTRTAVAQGVTPMWLAQFNHMRDTAINERYGSKDYTRAYNVDQPVKGAMMHVLTPVFPWWKAVAEEGGVPAILWQDYECDGFVSETQMAEMQLFHKKLEESLVTAAVAEAIAAKTAPDESWRSRSKAKRSFIQLD